MSRRLRIVCGKRDFRERLFTGLLFWGTFNKPKRAKIAYIQVPGRVFVPSLKH